MNHEQENDIDPIRIVLDKYREIDDILGSSNGIEVAVSLFGQERVDDYINMAIGKRDTSWVKK